MSSPKSMWPRIAAEARLPLAGRPRSTCPSRPGTRATRSATRRAAPALRPQDNTVGSGGGGGGGHSVPMHDWTRGQGVVSSRTDQAAVGGGAARLGGGRCGGTLGTTPSGRRTGACRECMCGMLRCAGGSVALNGGGRGSRLRGLASAVAGLPICLAQTALLDHLSLVRPQVGLGEPTVAEVAKGVERDDALLSLGQWSAVGRVSVRLLSAPARVGGRGGDRRSIAKELTTPQTRRETKNRCRRSQRSALPSHGAWAGCPGGRGSRSRGGSRRGRTSGRGRQRTGHERAPGTSGS